VGSRSSSASRSSTLPDGWTRSYWRKRRLRSRQYSDHVLRVPRSRPRRPVRPRSVEAWWRPRSLLELFDVDDDLTADRLMSVVGRRAPSHVVGLRPLGRRPGPPGRGSDARDVNGHKPLCKETPSLVSGLTDLRCCRAGPNPGGWLRGGYLTGLDSRQNPSSGHRRCPGAQVSIEGGTRTCDRGVRCPRRDSNLRQGSAVHPTGPCTNLNLLVSGAEVAVMSRHAKVRRGGYRRETVSDHGA